jgi:hypothetical protein
VKSDSPYYTPAPPVPGQIEIPIGTVHTCAGCHSDYICDSADCRLARVTEACASPCCGVLGSHSAVCPPVPREQLGLFDK